MSGNCLEAKLKRAFFIQGVSHWRMQSKSALRVRRINNFIDLWYLVASGGLHICVSSTSFQKNEIGWPQQPLTEKVLKFNMIFYDSTPKNVFSKHKYKAEFRRLMTLKSSVVIFQASKSLQPQWPQQPLTEKVLKFNLIMILPPKKVFRNIKIKMISRTWMNLKSSAVIFRP